MKRRWFRAAFALSFVLAVGWVSLGAQASLR